MNNSRYDPPYIRFWSNIRKTDSCWIWEGGTTQSGYGRIKIEDKSIRVHRLMYELKIGMIPEGLFVCHHCDNPCCVNPDHLFAGTHTDNMHDMLRKGRGIYPKGKRKPDDPRRGDTHSRSKLTRDKVDEIRLLFSSGNYNKSELGRMFGVTNANIGCIIRRVTWN